MKQYIHILLLAFFFSCTNEVSPDKTNAPTTNTPSQTSILIFKKEKKMEVWNAGVKSKTYGIKIDSKYPIGIFNSQPTDQGFRINFPNEFYREKNYQIDFKEEITIVDDELNMLINAETPIYIFPNDARNGKSFVASFSSPHWMNELYAKMRLYLLEYN